MSSLRSGLVALASGNGFSTVRTRALLAVLFTFLWCFTPAFAQNVTGTLTGIVSDASGAVVPNANITMKNEASGDVRKTISNGEGFFSITAVQPGKYTVAVESKGFQKWEQRGLVFNAGDKRTLADISLTVGSTGDTVVVEGTVAELSPVDSGEKAAVISQQELQNVSIVGSNAAEFVKILPGMAMTTLALRRCLQRLPRSAVRFTGLVQVRLAASRPMADEQARWISPRTAPILLIRDATAAKRLIRTLT